MASVLNLRIGCCDGLCFEISEIEDRVCVCWFRKHIGECSYEEAVHGAAHTETVMELEREMVVEAGGGGETQLPP